MLETVVLVLAQAAAENDLLFGLGQLLILGVECAVLVVIHGVVRLVAGLPLGGILAADDGLGQVIAVFVLAELEPLVLDDAGPRGLAVGVVDGSVALEIRLVQQFVLKADRAVFQCAQLVVKVGIDGAGVDDFVRQGVQFGLVFEIVGVQADLDAVQQVGNHLGVTAEGNALVQGVEVVVVEGQAHGQALDDESGQILAVTPPLFLGVALDEFLVDVTTNEGDSLFFQILWFMGDFLAQLLDLDSSLLRRHTPHILLKMYILNGREYNSPL